MLDTGRCVASLRTHTYPIVPQSQPHRTRAVAPPRCDRVLIETDTRSATANERAYYVAISRAREDVRIYTDDKAMLAEAMSRLDQKSAALEITPRQERELALGK